MMKACCNKWARLNSEGTIMTDGIDMADGIEVQKFCLKYCPECRGELLETQAGMKEIPLTKNFDPTQVIGKVLIRQDEFDKIDWQVMGFTEKLQSNDKGIHVDLLEVGLVMKITRINSTDWKEK